jgi:hypothetical protein
MSLNTARTNIFGHIVSNWSACPVLYQGQKITDTYIKKRTPWMYVNLVWDTHQQQSMAAPEAYFATLGIIAVKLYVRENAGAAVMDTLTDNLFSLFRLQQINNVTITEMNIDNDDYSKGWNVRSVSISFILRTMEEIA